MTKYEFRWEKLGSAASEETLEKWLTNPLYKRILLVGYLIYEIVRITITALATLSVTITVIYSFQALGQNGSSGIIRKHLPEGISVIADFPSSYQQSEIGMFWLLLSAALFVILVEEKIDQEFDIHRPLSLISLHIVYWLMAIAGQLYSIIRYRQPLSSDKLQTFKQEFIYDISSPSIIVYHFLRSLSY